MTLALHGTLQRGSLALGGDLVVAPGQTCAVLGENGAGKSSLLQLCAGLLPLATGRLTLGETVWDEPTRAQFLAPERRHVGYVPQEPLLFAGLTVEANVAYGLRARGVARKQAAQRARRWIERVGLAGHEQVAAHELSLGQSQRVALARALVTDPKLLLLDEPLAAVDAAARQALRLELRGYLARFAGPTLLVTHDHEDVAALASATLVLQRGQWQQCAGTPHCG